MESFCSLNVTLEAFGVLTGVVISLGCHCPLGITWGAVSDNPTKIQIRVVDGIKHLHLHTVDLTRRHVGMLVDRGYDARPATHTHDRGCRCWSHHPCRLRSLDVVA